MCCRGEIRFGEKDIILEINKKITYCTWAVKITIVRVGITTPKRRREHETKP